MSPMGLIVTAPDGAPEVGEGDDLAAMLVGLLGDDGLRDGDVVAVTSKVVAKAEGRVRVGGRPEAVADETEGARLFRTVCASCHGRRGEGGVGPSLVGVADRLTLDQHLAVVNEGRGTQMPAFQHALTPEEVAAVVEHERTQL